jgi:hypothetical protein
MLAAAGYRYIGMDHFALPQDELARAQSMGGSIATSWDTRRVPNPI